MSILGKILALLNVLGVAGFIALAAMTYAKRQVWEYQNFRADLLVDGLPIDSKSVEEHGDTDKAAVPLVARFGDVKNDRTLKELFPTDLVSTQVEEVDRVYGLLSNKVNEAPDVRKKNLLLAQILLALAGSHRRPEIYVDREFYLSMQAQLADDKNYAAFKKTLADAIPNAIDAVRFDTKNLSFEKAFQQTLADLPGEDKWKLAEVFLNKLPRDGATFDKAAEEAKNAAVAIETKAKTRDEAAKALDKATYESFVADAEVRATPTDEKKLAQKTKAEALVTAQKADDEAAAAAKKLPDPRGVASIVFLQTIRKDDKKTTVAEFVDEVLADALEEVHLDLNRRFEQANKEAHEGEFTVPEKSDNKLIRDRRRQAIARFLLAGIEVLDEKAVTALQDEAIAIEGVDEKKKLTSMVELPAYKRFISVVGIESAVWAVNEQQLALAVVLSDLESRILDERTAFSNRHGETIRALKKRAEEIDRLDARVKDVAEQASKQVMLAKGEKERVDIYVTDLKDSREQTTGEMKKLYGLTSGLNQVRLANRDAIRANELYLRRIEALEYEVLSYQQKLVEKEKADKDKKRGKTTP